jgi:hypothetical protein
MNSESDCLRIGIRFGTNGAECSGNIKENLL